jgi:glycosyltransferase involved in cell wall biosynthesis
MTRQTTTNTKRHCMVVHAHYPAGETRVQRQAEALLRNGYAVDVLCLRNTYEAAAELCNGVRVIRLPVRYRNHDRVIGKFWEYVRFFFLAMLKVTQLHIRHPYRTVQLHNLPDFIVFAAWMPKLLGARVILDLHDLMPEFFQARSGSAEVNAKVRLLYAQEKLACRFADHVVTVSEIWRQKLIARAGVPADKCSVVMNVADHNVFRRPADAEVRDIGQNGLHLIYHGSLGFHHGLDIAVNAIAKVREKAPTVRLTIHGGGEYLPYLVSLAKDLGVLDKQVCFSTTPMPINDLAKLIRTADLGLAPYRNDVFSGEIVPTKLMEYAALGMPAIAARTTAIDAYFKDTMVEFFTPGDVDDLARCILALYADRRRLAELTDGADKFNQLYNWEKLGAEYVALVERLDSR